MSPQEAVKFGNRCPVCRRSLTKGVEQRMEELADRPAETKPANAIGYMHLLPLSEIITTVLGVTYPGIQKVWEPYNALIAKFGDEYTVLIDAPKDKIAEVVEPEIAEAIIRVRENKIKVVPGYDGVYGQPIFSENAKETEQKTSEPVKQRTLADFV
jgi:PHP family Zn ribbon phosphoesterase